MVSVYCLDKALLMGVEDWIHLSVSIRTDHQNVARNYTDSGMCRDRSSFEVHNLTS